MKKILITLSLLFLINNAFAADGCGSFLPGGFCINNFNNYCICNTGYYDDNSDQSGAKCGLTIPDGDYCNCHTDIFEFEDNQSNFENSSWTRGGIEYHCCADKGWTTTDRTTSKHSTSAIENGYIAKYSKSNFCGTYSSYPQDSIYTAYCNSGYYALQDGKYSYCVECPNKLNGASSESENSDGVESCFYENGSDLTGDFEYIDRCFYTK